ncbi:hypothetical protein IP84_15560 [beta proteobacterium AAP99]|nr:hypothetical protein IP84_15560 [beta proteobacterium AAP99]
MRSGELPILLPVATSMAAALLLAWAGQQRLLGPGYGFALVLVPYWGLLLAAYALALTLGGELGRIQKRRLWACVALGGLLFALGGLAT